MIDAPQMPGHHLVTIAVVLPGDAEFSHEALTDAVMSHFLERGTPADFLEVRAFTEYSPENLPCTGIVAAQRWNPDLVPAPHG
jgi:hypothetical protein